MRLWQSTSAAGERAGGWSHVWPVRTVHEPVEHSLQSKSQRDEQHLPLLVACATPTGRQQNLETQLSSMVHGPPLSSNLHRPVASQRPPIAHVPCSSLTKHRSDTELIVVLSAPLVHTLGRTQPTDAHWRRTDVVCWNALSHVVSHTPPDVQKPTPLRRTAGTARH
jgi:hypothetical protein